MSIQPGHTRSQSGMSIQPSHRRSQSGHSRSHSDYHTHRRSQSASTPTLKVVLLGDSGVGKTCLRSQFVHHIFTNAYKSTIGGDYLTTSVYIPHTSQSDSLSNPPTVVTETGIAHNNYLDIDSSQTIHPRNRSTTKSEVHQTSQNQPSQSDQPDKVNLQIWDTAGQERFNSISQAFYRGTDVVVLVYDITNYESVLSLRDWFKRFMEHCHVDRPGVIIVGNKSDKSSERCVDLEEIREILSKNTTVSVDDYVENWDTDLREVTSKQLDMVDQLFFRVAEVGLDLIRSSGSKKLRGKKSGILGFDTIDLDDINFASKSRCAC